MEIYGAESSGKTTLALRIIAEAQRRGDVCAFIDADHSLDLCHARTTGVDLDALLVCQPDHAEQAIEVASILIRSGSVGVVCIDSAAALAPRRELAQGLEGDGGQLQTKMMKKAIPRLAGLISTTQAVCLFTNQLRARKARAGEWSEITPGGVALPMHAVQRLELRCAGTITRGRETIGSRVRARVVKNTLGPAFRDAEFLILFDGEVCRAPDRAVEAL